MAAHDLSTLPWRSADGFPAAVHPIGHAVSSVWRKYRSAISDRVRASTRSWMQRAEDCLRRQIAARIAAKRAGNDNGLEGKLLQACGHIAVASLAGDHELLPTGSHLKHAGSMADEIVKVIHKKPSPGSRHASSPNVAPVPCVLGSGFNNSGADRLRLPQSRSMRYVY